MPAAEYLFLLTTILALGVRLVRPRAIGWTADAPALAALGTAVVQILSSGPRVLLIPAYVVAALVGGLALVRAVRRYRSPLLVVPGGLVRRRMVGLGLGLVFVLLSGAVDRIATPLVDDIARELLVSDQRADLSTLGWEAAFHAAARHLRRDYPFGDWKRIPWDSLEGVYAPRIGDAERRHDEAGYYRALREYLWSIPDGHIGIEVDGSDPRTAAVGSGFGLAVMTLDDGRTIANVVVPDGPAARGGIRWGAEVVFWSGMPIGTALEQVPLLWAGDPPATKDGLRLARERLLTRAVPGSHVSVGYRNLGETLLRTADLVAVANDGRPNRRLFPPDSISLRAAPVTWRVLPNGYGYLRIRLELPLLGGLLPDRDVANAAEEFGRRQVPGVVIDVRGNGGGADKLVTVMMGHFFGRTVFYERAAFYDSTAGRFVADPRTTLYIRPRTPQYTGPIVALVDDDCVSSCEGIAWAVQQRGGSVVGWDGTHGSFGMAGATVRMPAHLSISYPNGSSVDSIGRIQLDSDAALRGGVTPDIRIRRTFETVRAQWSEHRDLALERGIEALRAAGRR